MFQDFFKSQNIIIKTGCDRNMREQELKWQ